MPAGSIYQHAHLHMQRQLFKYSHIENAKVTQCANAIEPIPILEGHALIAVLSDFKQAYLAGYSHFNNSAADIFQTPCFVTAPRNYTCAKMPLSCGGHV